MWLVLSALTSACLAPEFRIAEGGSGGTDTGGSSGGTGGAVTGSGGNVGSGSGGSTGGTDTAGGGTDTGGHDGSGGDDTSGGGGGDAAGGGPPGAVLTGVETVGADCPVQTLPESATLPTITKFPDPFTMLDGTPVLTEFDWECRHREISAQFQRYVLGTKHEKPPTVTGNLEGTTITVDLADGSKVGQFTALLSYPTNGDVAPFPVAILLQGSGFLTVHLQSLGVAIINLDVTGKIRRDSNTTDDPPIPSRETGLFSAFTGDTSAGALVAWAWGVSRLIDALEDLDIPDLDLTRLAVGGCSNYGRAALIAGALDARIALTLAREAGTGGIGAFRAAAYENVDATVTCTDRLSDPPLECSCTTEGDCAGTMEETYSERSWYSLEIEEFAGEVDRLPVDQHELMALIAPRALVAVGHKGLALLGRYSMAQGAHAARKAYQALGVSDRMAFVEETGGLCTGANDMTRTDDPYDATNMFIRRFLLGESGLNTEFWDDEILPDVSRWTDDWAATPAID